MNLMNFWKELLRSLWGKIKKISEKVLNFVKNIVSFFKDPKRLAKLKENRDLIAVSIKEKLETGNYRTVNCLFNNSTKEVEDYDENAQGIESESIDSQTSNTFGDKDMIVLK